MLSWVTDDCHSSSPGEAVRITLDKDNWRIDAFELWCWRGFLRIPWTAEIKPVHLKGNQSWIFTERTDAEVDASNILPEQRQKINHFPGIIAVVTIFTLNLYILACLCLIMFAVVYTYENFFGQFACFWSYLTCCDFFFFFNEKQISCLQNLCYFLWVFSVFLFICPDLFLLISNSFLELLYPYHYKSSLFTSVWICYTIV